MVRQLFQAQERGIGAVPIILDDRFQFPGESMYAALRAMSSYILSGTGSPRHVEELIALIGCLFQEIGISFRCQDSQAVLEVRAAAVVKRLSTPCKRLTSVRPTPQDTADHGEIIDIDTHGEMEGDCGRICL